MRGMKLMKHIVLSFGYIMPTVLLPYSPDNFNLHTTEPMHNNVVYMYAHGLGATQQQGHDFMKTSPTKKNRHWIMDGTIALFNFPDAKSDTMDYHKKQVNLGQHKDLERLHGVYNKTITTPELEDHDIVLTGLSRGSSTILNYVATYKPEQVKAVVVESPFDHLKSVAKHLLQQYCLNWIPFARNLSLKLAEKHFPSLNCNGIFPINVVRNISKDLPILLVHSQRDQVVPVNSSRKIYKTLREAGHNKVHLLELAVGNHGKLITGPEGRIYHNVVHAFYQHYGLPHDADAAQQGRSVFAQCQPSIERVNMLLKRA